MLCDENFHNLPDVAHAHLSASGFQGSRYFLQSLSISDVQSYVASRSQFGQVIAFEEGRDGRNQG